MYFAMDLLSETESLIFLHALYSKYSVVLESQASKPKSLSC